MLSTTASVSTGALDRFLQKVQAHQRSERTFIYKTFSLQSKSSIPSSWTLFISPCLLTRRINDHFPIPSSATNQRLSCLTASVSKTRGLETSNGNCMHSRASSPTVAGCPVRYGFQYLTLSVPQKRMCSRPMKGQWLCGWYDIVAYH